MSTPTTFVAPVPSLAELRECAVPFRVPLRTRFRGVTFREGVLLRGSHAAAEFAPFDDYDDVGAVRWLTAAIHAGWSEPLPRLRQAVRVNAIIPDVAVPQTRVLAQAAAESGCDTIKIKVASPTADGRNPRDSFKSDVQRVAAVRDVLNSVFGAGNGTIRLDVNAAWTVAQACEVLPLLQQAADDVEYVEQPCASLSDCAEVRAATGVHIAIDEGLRRAPVLDSAVLADIRDAADVVILKPIPLGGALQTMLIAQALDTPVVVSGSMDTSIGLSYVLATACALPRLDLACGLGTGALLAGDLTAQTLLPSGGVMHTSTVTVDSDALRTHAIPHHDPRHDWWLTRLANAATHLPEIGSVAP